MGTLSPHLHLVDTSPLIEPSSDADLVARAKGDATAFTELYRRYVDVIYRYCHHRLGSRSVAEDATSDIFVKAFASIKRCRDNNAFRSWLFTIAHNTVADSYRQYRPEDPVDAAAMVVDIAPGPEERAISEDEERSVRSLLARLAPQQAQIVELRLAGLTGPEIAEVLGCSLGAVKIGQLRGYSRLREILSSQEGHDHV